MIEWSVSPSASSLLPRILTGHGKIPHSPLMPLVRPDTLPGLSVPQGRNLVLRRREDQVAVVVVQHARDRALMALQQNRPLQVGCAPTHANTRKKQKKKRKKPNVRV